jgi:DnaJ-class molecular chaperone
MATPPAKKPCDKCAGEGTVPREVRKLEDGTTVPLGLRQREVCDRCGGGGTIPESYAGVPERAPGNIADQI